MLKVELELGTLLWSGVRGWIELRGHDYKGNFNLKILFFSHGQSQR